MDFDLVPSSTSRHGHCVFQEARRPLRRAAAPPPSPPRPTSLRPLLRTVASSTSSPPQSHRRAASPPRDPRVSGSTTGLPPPLHSTTELGPPSPPWPRARRRDGQPSPPPLPRAWVAGVQRLNRRSARARPLRVGLPRGCATGAALVFWSPEVIREIGKRHPLLIPPFTNFRLQRAVHDYLAGGDRKQRIVAKYGEIGNWETSNVTNMYRMLNNASFEIEISIDPITILVTQ